MEIRNLITFTKVSETQSLSKAAKLLGYAQSTVTMQMQQLEQELGVPLYERVGRQIRITREGQELLSYAVPIIRMSQDALKIGKPEKKPVDGQLRIGIPESLANEQMAEWTERYLKDCPLVELELRTEQGTDILLDLLRHNELDLVTFLGDRLEAADLIHAGEDRREPVHFYVGAEHPLLGGARGNTGARRETGKKRSTAVRQEDTVSLSDMIVFPLIRTEADLPYEQALDRLLEGYEHRDIHIRDPRLALRLAAGSQGVREPEPTGMEQTGMEPTKTVRSEPQTAAGQPKLTGGGETRNGLQGIVLAPESLAAEYVRAGRLKALSCSFPEPVMWQQTVYHRNKWKTEAMDAWFDMLEDKTGDRR